MSLVRMVRGERVGGYAIDLYLDWIARRKEQRTCQVV